MFDEENHEYEYQNELAHHLNTLTSIFYMTHDRNIRKSLNEIIEWVVTNEEIKYVPD